ncbi:MAG: Smr/MutS family protein [Betaproteobacteria bacterium]|nr:Smr/MutS family protein [Betaproteobacteria bacterium]
MAKGSRRGTPGRTGRAADDDRKAFLEAIAGTAPLPDHGRVEHSRTPPGPIPQQTLRDEQQALRDSLSDHYPDAELESGEALVFLRPGLPGQVLKKLRRGHWVIQDELDLHGLNRETARAQLAAFLNETVKHGLRCVRVIHGKGMGSKYREPVLKNLVRNWLAQRDDVLAFCQARPADGGGGAVVVLLKGGKQ